MPVAQLRADRFEIAPAALDELRLQRPVGDQRRKQRKIGGKTLLGLGPKIGKTLDSRIWMLGQIAKAEGRRLARGIAKDDDRPPCLDMRDGCGERCSAGRFEDQAEQAL